MRAHMSRWAAVQNAGGLAVHDTIQCVLNLQCMQGASAGSLNHSCTAQLREPPAT